MRGAYFSALTWIGSWIIFLTVFSFETTEAKVKRKYGCVLPEEPWYGSFVFNDRKRSLRYKCDEDYVLSVSRQSDRKCRRGKWTGYDLYCLNLDFTLSKCPKLRPPNNGHVSTEGRKVGNKATFRCDEGFVLDGSTTRTCREGRRWDGIMPVCKSRRTIEDVANHLKDTMIDSLAGATTGSKTGAQSRLSPGKSGLDVVLLVDVSSSIGDRSMESAKKFMKLLVDIFGVSNETSGGKNGTRFALLTFSNEADIVFNLNDGTARSKEEVKRRIDEIQNTGGGTNFRAALLKVVGGIFFNVIKKESQRLNHATRAVFLLTDAEETSTLEKDRLPRIRQAANDLKNEGHFEIFCIGVGQNIDETTLAEIASTPHIEHVFTLSKFDDLEKVGDIIAEKNIDYGRCGISGNTDIARETQIAAKGAWPWLGWLSVLDDKGIPHTCGGAIVCDRWFLTTASCVSKKEGDRVVPYNTSMLNVFLSDFNIFEKDTDEIWPVVQDILIHDNYTGEEIGDLGIQENDVALLDLGKNETERPIFDKYLRPICVAADNVSLSLAKNLLKMLLSSPNQYDTYTAGWGNAPDNFEHMDILEEKLMQNQRSVVKRKQCRKRYGDIDMERFFCVGEEFQESNSCMGDIGGPYMVQMSNKRYYSLGLALKTRGCTKRNNYSIFLNLLHPTVSDWLSQVLDGCNRVKDKDAKKTDEQ
uniref:C3/C5 convertase n=1 Tax=Ruditapes decussatus TaxID=104385 RepID=C4N894_9BIVA|nr:complement factor B-like protein [Ruditapes decussatus]